MAVSGVFAGVLEESSGKIAPGKANPPGTLGPHCWDLVPTFRAGCFFGRLIFMHLRCWEVLSFSAIQRQRCIKFRVLRAQGFYTPLPLTL